MQNWKKFKTDVNDRTYKKQIRFPVQQQADKEPTQLNPFTTSGLL